VESKAENVKRPNLKSDINSSSAYRDEMKQNGEMKKIQENLNLSFPSFPFDKSDAPGAIRIEMKSRSHERRLSF